MLSFEEYKELLRDYLKSLSEEAIREHYLLDSTFAAFVLKRWLEDRKKGGEPGA